MWQTCDLHSTALWAVIHTKWATKQHFGVLDTLEVRIAVNAEQDEPRDILTCEDRVVTVQGASGEVEALIPESLCYLPQVNDALRQVLFRFCLSAVDHVGEVKAVVVKLLVFQRLGFDATFVIP